MEDNTHWTPAPEDNLLGITDKHVINEYEAKGIAAAELYMFALESDVKFSVELIREIHRIAFAELYEWAGKWRTTPVVVGQLVPPSPAHVPSFMYHFVDNLNFKIINANSTAAHLECLVFAHYEFVKIHPFNNGNGRTGRMIMNVVALKFGYRPLELYHREGDSRKIYIDAMKQADHGDFGLLTALIKKELTTL